MCFFFCCRFGSRVVLHQGRRAEPVRAKIQRAHPGQRLRPQLYVAQPRTQNGESCLPYLARGARNLFIKFSPARRPLSASTKRAHSYSEGGLITKHATAVLLFVCGQKRTHFDRNLFDMRPGIEFLRRQFILMQLSDTLVGPRTFLL